MHQHPGIITTSGGFVGAVNRKNTLFDKCYSLGNITGLHGSGFIGTLANSSTSVISNSYSLTKASSNTLDGNFMSKNNSTDFSIQNSFYNNIIATTIAQGSENVSPLELQPITIKPEAKRIYGPDGTTPLIDLLGTGWTNKNCTLNLGDGSKPYIIPISTTIYPDFCE